MPETVLSKNDVGERLGVSHRTVTRLIHAKKIKAFKVGQQVRIRQCDLDAFIAAQIKVGV